MACLCLGGGQQSLGLRHCAIGEVSEREKEQKMERRGIGKGKAVTPTSEGDFAGLEKGAH